MACRVRVRVRVRVADLWPKGGKAWRRLLREVCKAGLPRPVEHLQDVACAMLGALGSRHGWRCWLREGRKAWRRRGLCAQACSGARHHIFQAEARCNTAEREKMIQAHA